MTPHSKCFLAFQKGSLLSFWVSAHVYHLMLLLLLLQVQSIQTLEGWGGTGII